MRSAPSFQPGPSGSELGKTPVCAFPFATYRTNQGNDVEGSHGFEDISSITARGFVHGDEYYGKFSRAFFTLFQVRGRRGASSGAILARSPADIGGTAPEP